MVSGIFCCVYWLFIIYFRLGHTWALIVLFLVSAALWSFSLKFNLQKSYILVNLALGFLGGLIYAAYIQQSFFGSVKPYTKYHADIVQVSPKSVVVQTRTALQDGFVHSGKFSRIRLILNKEQTSDLMKGQKVEFICNSIEKLSAGAFSLLEYLQSVEGLCRPAVFSVVNAPVTFVNRLRREIQNYIHQQLDQLPPYSFAGGFLLADTSKIHPRELYIFRRMGAAHLFSASGLHLGLLFGLFVYMFRLVRLPGTGQVIGLIVSLGYLILLDYRISLLRAFVFLCLFLLTKSIDRKVFPLNILFLTGALLEIYSPLSSFSPSFILSFVVTLSILYFYPRVRQVILFQNNFLRDHISVSLSATIASAFMGAWLFSHFNALSVIYNIVLVPFSAAYLTSCILYVVMPAKVFMTLVCLGDGFFHAAAWFHARLWEAYYPELLSVPFYIWLAAFTVFILTLIRFFTRLEFWKIYGRFASVCAFVFASFFASVNFTGYPRFGALAFGGGVMIYHNNTLTLLGKPSFAKSLFISKLSAVKFPFHTIQGDPAFEKPAQETLLLPLQSYKPLRQDPRRQNHEINYRQYTKGGLLNYDNRCFLLYSNMNPEKWSAQFFKACDHLYIIVPKKVYFMLDTQAQKDWRSLFLAYYKFSSITFIRFFKWHVE